MRPQRTRPQQRRQQCRLSIVVLFVVLLILHYPNESRSFSVSPFPPFVHHHNTREQSSSTSHVPEEPPNTNTNAGRETIERQHRPRKTQPRSAATTIPITAGILSSFLLVASPLQQPPPAIAFDNGIPEMKNYRNIPKHPGKPPTELGISKVDGRLAMCDGAPNCFSTTGDDSHLLQSWKPKVGTSKSQAMDQLVATIQAYPPGQARVDRGGFQIVTAKPEYLYVQFESMKHGFIDDVEFAVTASGPLEVQVRSASRMGFLDLGVNGKRLNWISNHLVETYGWRQPSKPITPDDYPDYFPMMPFSFDDYIRSVLSPETCPVPANPLDCKDPASGPA